MTIIQSIILGIIQGLTEFLPISSSAHLVLVPNLMGWQIPESQVFPFGVLVQLGTLAAVIIYFWSDLLKIIKAFFKGIFDRKPFVEPNARMGWFLILATIPAMLSGLLLKDMVEAAFNSPNATAYFLFGTAALLVIAEIVGKRSRNLMEMTWFDSLWIGIFQAISIFPGVSRSGSTIVGGMTRNMDRPSAARFSFLMSIPVMLGAGLISTLDVIKMPNIGSFLPVVLIGMVVALVVGYLSIHWLLNFLAKRSFFVFAGYCVLLGAVVLITGAIHSNNVQSAVITPDAEVIETTSVLPVNLNEYDNLLTVAYTPSMEWLLPAMSTCARTQGDFSIVTHLTPADQLSSVSDQMILRWGAPADMKDYAAVIGTERLAIIVNPQNPLVSLPFDLMRKISTAELGTWSSVQDQCPECFSTPLIEELSTLSPALIFYPSDDESQQLFGNAVMGGQPVASAPAMLVPGGKQMLESVAENPGGIGFLPARFINQSVKEVTITDLDATTLQMPLLAVSSTEPTGKAREWLLCLQKVLNP